MSTNTYMAKEYTFINHLLRKISHRVQHFQMADEYPLFKGYGLDKTNIYLALTLPSIDHEIAHMVEMQSPRRWIMNDWGFPKNGQPSDKNLFAACIREIRVRTIQSMIGGDKYYCLADHQYWGRRINELLPFKQFKDKEDFFNWEMSFVSKTSQSYSLDKIENDWNIRADYILNWMETI